MKKGSVKISDANGVRLDWLSRADKSFVYESFINEALKRHFDIAYEKAIMNELGEDFVCKHEYLKRLDNENYQCEICGQVFIQI
jgi:hypothetical protein